MYRGEKELMEKREEQAECDHPTESKFTGIYQAIIKKMNEGFALLEILHDGSGQPNDFRFLEMNPFFEEILEIRAADMIGKTIMEVFPDIRPCFKDFLFQVAQSGVPQRLEESSHRTHRHYDILASIPEKNYIAVLVRDVTQCHIVQEELKQQKDILKMVIEHMSDGLFILDKDYKFTLINEGGENFFYQPEEIKFCGDSFRHTKYFDTSGKELTVEEMAGSRALKGERIKNHIIQAVRPDKTLYFSISGSPVLQSNGDITAAVICSRDITEQYENDRILINRMEQLETIFENITEGIFLTDPQGQFILVNQEGKRLLSYQTKALGENLNYIQCVDMDGKIITKEQMPGIRAMHGEKVRNQRMILKHPDQEIVVSVSAVPIYDQEGNITAITVSSRDVTNIVEKQHIIDEQKEVMLKAEREKNEMLTREVTMKDEFISLITHEFRTPLSVISLALQTMNLLYKEEITSNISRYAASIQNNTNRLIKLVNNLLDITRINANRLGMNRTNLDLVQFSREIIDSVKEYTQKKSIKIRFSSSYDKMIIGTDEILYERVLLNLLSNAIKYSEQGKTIFVKLFHKKIKDQEMIGIRVKDQGIGIPEDKKEIIFEKFGQANNLLTRPSEGTGLGLYLVKRVVTLLGGSITFKSKENVGSEFTFYLPNEKAEMYLVKPIFFNNDVSKSTEIEFSDLVF